MHIVLTFNFGIFLSAYEIIPRGRLRVLRFRSMFSFVYQTNQQTLRVEIKIYEILLHIRVYLEEVVYDKLIHIKHD